MVLVATKGFTRNILPFDSSGFLYLAKRGLACIVRAFPAGVRVGNKRSIIFTDSNHERHPHIQDWAGP